MTITEQVKRRLWSSSGGYCQNPSCRTELFTFFDSGRATSIEELAHVIARKRSGARGKSELPDSERDQFENLVMLCPSCHTLVDKNEEEFPVQLLLQWKYDHEATISNALLSPVFDTRFDLRARVRQLLGWNKHLFDSYGPHSSIVVEPMSDAAHTWARMTISDVVPNNRKVVALLRANEHLLTDAELETALRFRVHAEAFEYNRLSGNKMPDAPLFPTAMDNILNGET